MGSSLAPAYLKRIYADDPALNSPKIVYSVCDDAFDGALDSRMQEKLKQEGFSDQDLAALGQNPVTWIDLQKFAIDFSDGIVQSSESVDPEVLEYIKKSGKPFLPFPGADDYVDAYLEFYKSL